MKYSIPCLKILKQPLINPINQKKLASHKISSELLNKPIGELLGDRRYSLGVKDTGVAIFKGFITLIATLTVLPNVISYLLTHKRIDQHLFNVSGKGLVKKIEEGIAPFEEDAKKGPGLK